MSSCCLGAPLAPLLCAAIAVVHPCVQAVPSHCASTPRLRGMVQLVAFVVYTSTALCVRVFMLRVPDGWSRAAAALQLAAM